MRPRADRRGAMYRKSHHVEFLELRKFPLDRHRLPCSQAKSMAIGVDPKEIYVVQEFRRDGTSDTLLLADRLVDAFCLATKFEPTGEPLESFPGSKIDKITAQHPFLDRKAIVHPPDFVL